jgi:hypothetical protein
METSMARALLIVTEYCCIFAALLLAVQLHNGYVVQEPLHVTALSFAMVSLIYVAHLCRRAWHVRTSPPAATDAEPKARPVDEPALPRYAAAPPRIVYVAPRTPGERISVSAPSSPHISPLAVAAAAARQRAEAKRRVRRGPRTARTQPAAEKQRGTGTRSEARVLSVGRTNRKSNSGRSR